jgi:hypothetical protein
MSPNVTESMKSGLTTLIIAMKRGGTTVFKRVKRTIRQEVWLTPQWRQILERLEEKIGCNKADILRWGLGDLARKEGVIEEDWPIRLKPIPAVPPSTPRRRRASKPS